LEHQITGALQRVPDRTGKPAGAALQVGKYPVAALVPEAVQGGGKKASYFMKTTPYPRAGLVALLILDKVFLL